MSSPSTVDKRKKYKLCTSHASFDQFWVCFFLRFCFLSFFKFFLKFFSFFFDSSKIIVNNAQGHGLLSMNIYETIETVAWFPLSHCFFNDFDVFGKEVTHGRFLARPGVACVAPLRNNENLICHETDRGATCFD